MNKIIQRAAASILIGAAVFFLGRPIIGWTAYDAHLQAIFYLSGIIAAGCYWIGSANNGKSD